MREVLDLQDVESFGDDMCEQDPLSMQIPNMSVRETVLHSLKQICVLKNHDLVHNILPEHQKEEYLTHLKELENMNLYMSLLIKEAFHIKTDTFLRFLNHVSQISLNSCIL